VFRFDRLTVCLASKPIPLDAASASTASGREISCMSAIGKDTFIGSKDKIFVYNRANTVRTYLNENKANFLGMLAIGKYLLTYDDKSYISIYDVKERSLLHSLKMMQSEASISALIHPSTYVNKILVGYSNGIIELWNFMRKTVVYTFKSHIEYFQTRKKSRTQSKPSLGRGQRLAYDDEEDDFMLDSGHRADQSPHSTPSITCIDQSPACDVLAFGFSSGDILIINAKLDKILFSFHQGNSAVTSLSFRTDIGAESNPYLASGSVDGRIYVWNLGKVSSATSYADSISMGGSSEDIKVKTKIIRKLEFTMDEAHGARVSKVQFLHGEPIMISSAEDNSLKVWIFDSSDGTARLLRSREGHCGPSTRIRYYGGVTNMSMADNADATSCEIISAGSDSTLRYFNTAIEAQNREMSQKPVLKKLGLSRRNERLPPVAGFDCSEARQRDWGNLVTIHKNHSNAYIWKYKDRVVSSEIILKQPYWKDNEKSYSLDQSTHSTSVAVSTDGNFALVGSRGGIIYRYNLQSGLGRGTYPVGHAYAKAYKKESDIQKAINMREENDEDELSHIKDKIKSDVNDPEALVGHSNEVTGLFVDITTTVLVSCGLDSQIIFWDFATQKIISKISVDSPQTLMVGFKDGSYVAVCGQDRVARIYDLPTKKLSRRFVGHSREVSDMAFSPDGRRFITSSLDCTVRTWDMATGRCLSWVSLRSPVLSITVSLSGEYLCASRADSDGIYMFIDKSLYESVHFWKEPDTPTPISDSPISKDDNNDDNGDFFYDDKYDGGADNSMVSDSISPFTLKPSQKQAISEDAVSREGFSQRGHGTITLSAIPKAYWVTLFNLDEIKERNKTKAPPAAPVNAPFFLPTIVKGQSVNPLFPTPEEFSKMLNSGGSAVSNDDIGISNSKTIVGEKRFLDSVAPDLPTSSKASEVESEASIIAQLASFNSSFGKSSVWDDDEDSNENDDESDEENVTAKGGGSAIVSAIDKKITSSIAASAVSKSKIISSSSRILKRQSKAPRCTLVAFIMKDFTDAFNEDEILSDQEIEDVIKHDIHTLNSHIKRDSCILDYLKKSTPPEIDIEMRLLCRHEQDTEGLGLLKLILYWFCTQFHSGENFEILQAYLHRFLTQYSDMLISSKRYSEDVLRLSIFHEKCCSRFRHLVQKNLCLLKMFANLSNI
jgi:U3 small nucleolar RNA-associated protein 21